MKLTEQEKQIKRQKDALQHICNKLLSAFSFGKIKFWRDVYLTVGLTPTDFTNSDSTITFPELKKYCEELKDKLVQSTSQKPVEPKVEVAVVELKKESLPEPPTKELDEDYGLVSSPNERVYLYWFQKLACANLLKGFGIEK